ncbi:MAG: hypothetical protein K0R94_532 [Burkholderiales bacterium]|jgi:putative flippase GtrA|nr:hypothetical protein [Burkholderiales bacterium]
MFKILNLLSSNKFVGFLFIGGFNTVMGLILYSFLLYLGLHYLLASTATFIFGVLEGYILNSILVFKEKPQFKSLLRFTLVYFISLALNLFMMYVFVDMLHTDKLLAQIITCFILAGVNFYLIKMFVYSVQLGPSNMTYHDQ